MNYLHRYSLVKYIIGLAYNVYYCRTFGYVIESRLIKSILNNYLNIFPS